MTPPATPQPMDDAIHRMQLKFNAPGCPNKCEYCGCMWWPESHVHECIGSIKADHSAALQSLREERDALMGRTNKENADLRYIVRQLIEAIGRDNVDLVSDAYDHAEEWLKDHP